MFYLGIDVAKRSHEAIILDEAGQPLGGSFSFANSLEGGEKVIGKLTAVSHDPKAFICCLEATGHYWLALYSFLAERGYRILVVNPLQSDALRELFIRRTKTDIKDAFVIAELARIGRARSLTFPHEKYIALQSICRLRFELVDQTSTLKLRILNLLDKVFPEYENLFSTVFIKASRELLKTAPTPEALLAFSVKELSRVLQKASRGRFKTTKAREIQTLAETSFGIKFASETFTFQIRLLVQHLEFIEKQIEQLDDEIETYLQGLDTKLRTIPGIGSVITATVLGEVQEIERFDSAKKFVAYCGLDPSVHQSGQFQGEKSHISKRGSPYLRRALWLGAHQARLRDPRFKAFYDKKIKEGKASSVALGATTRKLAVIVYSIMKSKKAYDANYVWNAGNLETKFSPPPPPQKK